MPLKKKDDSQIIIRRGLDEDERPAIEVRRWRDGGFDPGGPRTVPLTPDIDRILKEIDPPDSGSMPSRLETLGRELASIPGIDGLELKLLKPWELEISHTTPRHHLHRVARSIDVRVEDYFSSFGIEADEVPSWSVRWSSDDEERSASFSSLTRGRTLDDIVNVTINLDAPLQPNCPPLHPNCRSEPPPCDVFHFTAEQFREALTAQIPLDHTVLIPETFRRSLEKTILELLDEHFAPAEVLKNEPAHPSIVGQRMLWRATEPCYDNALRVHGLTEHDFEVVVQAEDADRRLAMVYVCATPGLRLWVDRLDLHPAPEPSATCSPGKPGNDR